MTKKALLRELTAFQLLFALLFCVSAQAFDVETAVSRYNFVIGTQTIGAAYGFTDAPRLVETAQGIRDLGSHVIKFAVAPSDGKPDGRSLAEIAQDDVAVRTVLDMDFAQEILWALPQATRTKLFAPETLPIEYREIYDLARFLRTKYRGSGRSFYLGNWEGDWELTRVGKIEPTPEDAAKMVAWARTRQQAVDDAKRDTPDSDVKVYFYVEVNRVIDARKGRLRVSNGVLSAVNPDFVSYSSYEVLANDASLSLTEALDEIQSKLRPKADLPERRVFIGEFGFPANRYDPDRQNAKSVDFIETALAWGCPFVLYWEFYNNEVSNGKSVGFWMIDDQGRKQPIYDTYKKYYDYSTRFVRDFMLKQGRAPSGKEYAETMRHWIGGGATPAR